MKQFFNFGSAEAQREVPFLGAKRQVGDESAASHSSQFHFLTSEHLTVVVSVKLLRLISLLYIDYPLALPRPCGNIKVGDSRITTVRYTLSELGL